MADPTAMASGERGTADHPARRRPRITIARTYEVECREVECDRVVSVEPTRAVAEESRREHAAAHRQGTVPTLAEVIEESRRVH